MYDPKQNNTLLWYTCTPSLLYLRFFFFTMVDLTLFTSCHWLLWLKTFSQGSKQGLKGCTGEWHSRHSLVTHSYPVTATLCCNHQRRVISRYFIHAQEFGVRRKDGVRWRSITCTKWVTFFSEVFLTPSKGMKWKRPSNKCIISKMHFEPFFILF